MKKENTVIEKALSKALSRQNILLEYREIVNCQTPARNSRTQFALWERCDGRFPNRYWPKHDFYRVSLFALTRQELSSTRTSIVVISLLKSIIDDQISEILSLNFTAMELSSDVLCPFLVWGLRSRLALISAGSSRWNYEVKKRFSFYVHRHGIHDQMMCLISLFLDQFQISDKVPIWNPSRLETLRRFWMEMLRFS